MSASCVTPNLSYKREDRYQVEHIAGDEKKKEKSACLTEAMRAYHNCQTPIGTGQTGPLSHTTRV